MFNYVVKDPNSSGLSRELWIKDQAAYRRSGLTLCPRTCVVQRLLVRGVLLTGIACSGLDPTRLRLAQQLMTFTANFLRVSNFVSRVNPSFRFLLIHIPCCRRRSNRKLKKLFIRSAQTKKHRNGLSAAERSAPVPRQAARIQPGHAREETLAGIAVAWVWTSAGR